MAGSRSRILWALPTASTPTRTWATIRSITPTRLGNQALAGVFQTVLSVFSSYYGPSRYGFTGLGASVSQGIANRLGTQGSLSAGRQTLGGGSGYTPTGFASSQQGQTYAELVARNRARVGRFGLSSFSFGVLAFDGSGLPWYEPESGRAANGYFVERTGSGQYVDGLGRPYQSSSVNGGIFPYVPQEGIEGFFPELLLPGVGPGMRTIASGVRLVGLSAATVTKNKGFRSTICGFLAFVCRDPISLDDAGTDYLRSQRFREVTNSTLRLERSR